MTIVLVIILMKTKATSSIATFDLQITIVSHRKFQGLDTTTIVSASQTGLPVPVCIRRLQLYQHRDDSTIVWQSPD